MLARRAMPAAAVRERLAARFADAEVAAAVKRLEELGVLDDRAYAEAFVRDRFERAGYGPVRIRRDLLARGVDRSMVAEILDRAIDSDQERDRAARVLERYRCRGNRPASLQGAYRHLVGRGFSPDVVRDLLRVSL